VFYEPTGRGYEKIIKERLDGWRRLKAKAQQADGKNERFKTK
jgi:hypothetical protein